MWWPKSCLRKIGTSCLIWSVQSLQQLSPPYKMHATFWTAGGTPSQPSVGPWMSLKTNSNVSHWLMNIQKHQRTLQRERVMQGTLQWGSVSTTQLCLTSMRLVSTSPCAAHMDTHLNTTTTQFEQQKQHPPTLHASHCSVLTTLQPFCITFHQSLASTSPATIRDFRNEIRGFRKKTPTTQPQNPTFVRPIRDFRKKTPTTQDLVFLLFTAFAIYEKSSQSFWQAL